MKILPLKNSAPENSTPQKIPPPENFTLKNSTPVLKIN